MIVVIDSGAGGHGVSAALTKSYAGKIVCVTDDAYFPYGNLTADKLKERLEINIKKARTFNPELILIGCNTASLQCEFDDDVIRLPKPDENDFDLVLASASASTYFPQKGLDSTSLINSIQLYSASPCEATKDNVLVAIVDTLSDTIEGSKVFLGCTHFSFVLDLFFKVRPDLEFYEPDYAKIVNRDSTKSDKLFRRVMCQR